MRHFQRFLLLSLILGITSTVRAEDGQGSAAQVIREVHLKKDPSEDAPSLGRLPRGTILTLKGDRQNGFAEVSVELEDGSIDGWIRVDALNRRARGEDVDDDESDRVRLTEEEREVRYRPRSRLTIPKDEGLLLRRDSSFFYGLQAGGNYALIQSETTDYFGIGLMGGAHVGIFFDRNIPAKLEAGYMQMNGTAEDGNFVEFGFVETSLSVAYTIDKFEIFGAVSYAYGISLSDIPQEIKVEGAADLSSLYGGGGIGYAFSIGEVTDIAMRLRYMLSFIQVPVAFQGISFQLYFQFRG